MSKTITLKDINSQEYQMPASQLQWRPSCYGIIIQDASILLSRQFDGYDLPGGGLELGELPEDGVLREIKEETGLDAANPRFMAIKNSFFQSAHADNRSFHCLMLYYVCDFVGGELSTDGFDEHEKKYAQLAEWVPLNKLDSLKVANSVDWREIVKKATA